MSWPGQPSAVLDTPFPSLPRSVVSSEFWEGRRFEGFTLLPSYITGSTWFSDCAYGYGMEFEHIPHRVAFIVKRFTVKRVENIGCNGPP